MYTPKHAKRGIKQPFVNKVEINISAPNRRAHSGPRDIIKIEAAYYWGFCRDNSIKELTCQGMPPKMRRRA